MKNAKKMWSKYNANSTENFEIIPRIWCKAGSEPGVLVTWMRCIMAR